MQRLNQALCLLADADAVGDAFFAAAARALVEGLGCRWAGFAGPAGDGQAEVFALCGGDGPGTLFRYAVAGTTCAAVCVSEPGDGYRFHAQVQDVPWPRGHRRRADGPYSYRGEAVFAPDGTRLCHVFAVGDPLAEDAPEERGLVRLVARRAAAELARPAGAMSARAATRACEAHSRSRTGYLAHCADAMRTPLNAMVGFAEAIHRLDGATPVRRRDYAAQIMAIGAQMRDVMDAIQLLAKAEQGELALVEEPVDLNRIAAEAAERLGEAARESGVALHVAAHAPSLPVLADPALLLRLAHCLLANAVSFTPAGGQVAIAVGIGPHQGPELRIADTGAGMAEDEIAALLVPFRRPRRLDGGHGLGLPLANTLCALHDGTLAIASAPGAGTTVSVRLPPGRQLRDIGPHLRAVA